MGLLISQNVLATELYDQEIVNADTGEGQDCKGHQSFLFDNLHFLLLGAQGPDVLSAYGLNSIIDLHPFLRHRDLGNKTHLLTGNDLIKAFAFEISGIEDPKERNAFESWSFGFLSHYILDSRCYPYVLYFSRFSNDGRKGRYWLSRQLHLEEAIDIAMANRFEATYFIRNPEDALPFVKSETRIIDKHFKKVIEKLLHEEVSDDFYSECVSVSRAKLKRGLYVNSGFRRITNIGNGFKVSGEIGDRCLNVEGVAWKDPLLESTTNESFLDLFAKAQDDLNQVYESIVLDGFPSLIGEVNWPNDFFGFPPESKVFFSDDNPQDWSNMVGK